MSLSIELEREEAPAGSTARGVVRGLDAHPDARVVMVSLVHEAKRWKDHPRVDVRYDLAGGRSAELSFELSVPADAFPTFAGRHYGSGWRVEARLDVPRSADPTAATALVVRADPRRAVAGSRPAAAKAPGSERFRIFAGAFLVADLLALAALYVALGDLPTVVALSFVVPALVTLATLVWLGLRPAPVERFELSAPRTDWRLGEEVIVKVAVQGAPDRIEGIELALKGEEVWMVSTGKTAHEQRASFHEDVRPLAGTELTAARTGARRWDHEVRFRLPELAPPSHGRELQWSAKARVRVRGRVDPAVTLPLEVAGTVPVEERG